MDTKALRQKILDLAIRGKLAPQDPNNEPASVLLERIRAEKLQMVKDGKLKSKDIKNDTIIFKGDDNLHYEKFADGSVKCIEDEIPFELPEGWAWARLASLIELFITGPFGSALHKSDYVTDGIPLINPINIIDGKVIPVDKMQVSSETVKRLSSFKVATNDIVIARRGDMGRCAVVQLAQKGWLCGTGSFILRLPAVLCSEYFAVCLRSPYAVEHMSVNSIGNTMLNLNQTILKSILMPVPPCAEQNRIIKVIFDATHLLAKTAAHSEELAVCVAKAKAKILDLAIRGKLVPQDPNDEPASVLLERIRTEKEELIKQGKIKRNKKESVIFKGSDNSYYQDLPENWEICSIMAIAEVDLGKTLDKNKNTGKFYPYLRSVNIKWNEIDLSDIKEMQFEKDELQRYSIIKGDLLICEGGDVGRCCIWSSDETIYYQNALHRVRFHGGCEPKYFLYFMMYLEHTGYLKRISNGVTIKHLTKTVLTTIPFMLPPLAEQKRIVDEIEKIFATLDNIANQVA